MKGPFKYQTHKLAGHVPYDRLNNPDLKRYNPALIVIESMMTKSDSSLHPQLHKNIIIALTTGIEDKAHKKDSYIDLLAKREVASRKRPIPKQQALRSKHQPTA